MDDSKFVLVMASDLPELGMYLGFGVAIGAFAAFGVLIIADRVLSFLIACVRKMYGGQP